MLLQFDVTAFVARANNFIALLHNGNQGYWAERKIAQNGHEPHDLKLYALQLLPLLVNNIVITMQESRYQRQCDQ